MGAGKGFRKHDTGRDNLIHSGNQDCGREDTMKREFSKPLIVSILTTVLLYTAIVLLFSWHGRHVPDSLTYSFYGFFGFETGWLALIKINKVREDKNGKHTNYVT